MKVLVIDVGGSHVKMLATGRREWRKFRSGPRLSAKEMVRKTTRLVADWEYDAVSIGLPSPVAHGLPLQEPGNLGRGWVGFDFEKAFGRRVKIINDAAMQALGSYKGGSMIYISLGTGLGSALISNGTLEAIELGNFPNARGKPIGADLSKKTLVRVGRATWERRVIRIVNRLRDYFGVDYAVLGGGNAKKLTALPARTFRADDNTAFLGGSMLWRRSCVRTGIPVQGTKGRAGALRAA
jgi:polyphosphate glucokinase